MNSSFDRDTVLLFAARSISNELSWCSLPLAPSDEEFEEVCCSWRCFRVFFLSILDAWASLTTSVVPLKLSQQTSPGSSVLCFFPTPTDCFCACVCACNGLEINSSRSGGVSDAVCKLNWSLFVA